MKTIRAAVAFASVVAALVVPLTLAGCGGDDGNGLSTEVPDVRGLSEAGAGGLITSAGLRVGDVSEDRSAPVPVAGGAVVRDQSPGPGRTLQQGESVDLVIGAPLPPVTVPDVVGKDLRDAQRALARQNLVGKAQGPVADEDSAIVVGQFPAAGEDAAVRSVVRLTVR
jgi:beta-lactam-binding protein with PASTA domain